jgi:hypothetical protein
MADITASPGDDVPPGGAESDAIARAGGNDVPAGLDGDDALNGRRVAPAPAPPKSPWPPRGRADVVPARRWGKATMDAFGRGPLDAAAAASRPGGPARPEPAPREGRNSGPPPGTGRRRGGFQAHILTADGGYRHLGRYGTAEEAASAYRAAATRPREEAPGGDGFDAFGKAVGDAA